MEGTGPEQVKQIMKWKQLEVGSTDLNKLYTLWSMNLNIKCKTFIKNIGENFRIYSYEKSIET